MNRTIDLLNPEGQVAFKIDADDILKELQSQHEKTLVVKEPEAKTELRTEKKELVVKEAGILAQVANFEVASLPVGAAVGGGSIAVLASELVDGFMTTQSIETRGAVKIGVAVATLTYGKKLLGSKLSMWAAGFLVFDGLRDVIPVDLYVQRAANMITGTVTKRGLAQRVNRNESPVVRQANAVVADYYQRVRSGG